MKDGKACCSRVRDVWEGVERVCLGSRCSCSGYERGEAWTTERAVDGGVNAGDDDGHCEDKIR